MTTGLTKPPLQGDLEDKCRLEAFFMTDFPKVGHTDEKIW